MLIHFMFIIIAIAFLLDDPSFYDTHKYTQKGRFRRLEEKRVNYLYIYFSRYLNSGFVILFMACFGYQVIFCISISRHVDSVIST